MIVGKLDMTIEICGLSGQGTISSGKLLNHSLSGAGFRLMAFDSYPAEIRGFGRCVARCRVCNERVLALSGETDVLISLDDEQSRMRIPSLADDAVVLFDNHPPSTVEEGRSIAAMVEAGVDLFGVPLTNLAGAAGFPRGRNMVALGAFSALFGVSTGHFHRVIEEKFSAKGKQVVNNNLACFDAGYRSVKDTYGKRLLTTFAVRDVRSEEAKELISGTAAVSRGACDAGCRLFFGYPITPATPIMESLAVDLPRQGGKVVQMEDEISAIGAVVGSFFTGTRAMTATSGPGLALMTEMLSLGIMAEIPVVVVNVQRAGPSTGLPTKTEQSDLQAAIFGGPGDSPRIVLAASDVSD